MGVYIPHMRKPETCGECPFYADHQDGIPPQCGRANYWVWDGVVQHDGKPPQYCDILFIPDHGRLVDADALAEKAPELVEYLAELAPTVIPAGREECGQCRM